jgi:recombinational DNA repair protein RecT
MAKKTVFKRAVKWLNLSSDDMVAIMLSDNAEFGGMRNATPKVREIPTDPFADTQQDTLELNTETAPAVDEDFNNS